MGYIKLVGTAAIFLAIYLGYTYVVNLQKSNAALEKQKIALEISNKQLTIQVENIKQDIKDVEISLGIVNKEFINSKKQVNYLSNLFADHNFTRLVKKKSGLITIRMQKATKKLFKEIEEVTGSVSSSEGD